MALSINILNSIKEITGSFGGKVWEEVQVLGTVQPGEFKLQAGEMQANKTTGETFVSNQILVPNGDQMMPINIKADEIFDETTSFKLIQYIALRDIEGSKYTKGSKTIKAVAVIA